MTSADLDPRCTVPLCPRAAGTYEFYNKVTCQRRTVDGRCYVCAAEYVRTTLGWIEFNTMAVDRTRRKSYGHPGRRP